jgi:hypothetical protein
MTNEHDDGVTIRPANSCLRRLAWDCELSQRPAALELYAALRSAGYVDDSRADWLYELRHGSGHSVLIVPRTGRVQLRLHYLTPAPERATAARALAQHVAEISRSFRCAS